MAPCPLMCVGKLGSGIGKTIGGGFCMGASRGRRHHEWERCMLPVQTWFHHFDPAFAHYTAPGALHLVPLGRDDLPHPKPPYLISGQ